MCVLKREGRNERKGVMLKKRWTEEGRRDEMKAETLLEREEGGRRNG